MEQLSPFSPLNIFHPCLVVSTDTEPVDADGWFSSFIQINSFILVLHAVPIDIASKALVKSLLKINLCTRYAKHLT